ncbi:MAG: hypothetical protein LBK73_06590, partial [Treponema sp.]|nr:hypothetical protein [Treponema sp.]
MKESRGRRLAPMGRRGAAARRSRRGAESPSLMRDIARRHHGRRGSPRAREASRQDRGKRVGLKKAARLPRENGLNARRRR